MVPVTSSPQLKRAHEDSLLRLDSDLIGVSDAIDHFRSTVDDLSLKYSQNRAIPRSNPSAYSLLAPEEHAYSEIDRKLSELKALEEQLHSGKPPLTRLQVSFVTYRNLAGRVALHLLRNQSRILAPVNRLPDDCLSIIFLFASTREQLYEDPFDSTLRPNSITIHPPHVLQISQVCQRWRRLAVESGQLWTYIELPPPGDSPRTMSMQICGSSVRKPALSMLFSTSARNAGLCLTPKSHVLLALSCFLIRAASFSYPSKCGVNHTHRTYYFRWEA